jgi:hypothetical protein
MNGNSAILLFCAIAVLCSCKKLGSAPEEDTYRMVVKEYKTNIPLARVKINLYKCSRYDNIFGCQAISVFATRFTNEDGHYDFTQSELNQSNEGIVLSKSQYWDVSGGQGDVFMEPEALVNIVLKAIKSYPDTSFFELGIVSELGNGSSKTFRSPKDSTFTFRIFGNEKNTINWVVYARDLSCKLYCERDTLATGNLILSPKKFETLNTSINY